MPIQPVMALPNLFKLPLVVGVLLEALITPGHLPLFAVRPDLGRVYINGVDFALGTEICQAHD